MIYQGSCHCETVRFEVNRPEGLTDLKRCDCSLCSRKGAIMATAELEQLRITAGEESLSLYQWNTKTAKHYFCSICGIYTHHQRRKNPNQYGFNLACIEGIDIREFGDVSTTDGSTMSVVRHK